MNVEGADKVGIGFRAPGGGEGLRDSDQIRFFIFLKDILIKKSATSTGLDGKPNAVNRLTYIFQLK